MMAVFLSMKILQGNDLIKLCAMHVGFTAARWMLSKAADVITVRALIAGKGVTNVEP